MQNLDPSVKPRGNSIERLHVEILGYLRIPLIRSNHSTLILLSNPSGGIELLPVKVERKSDSFKP
jgi:hypothetical protein